MARLKTYKTLKDLFKDTEQISVQNILNRRISRKGMGWTDFKMTDELEAEVIQMTVDILGGRAKTKERIARVLEFSNVQNWGLDRIYLSGYEGKYRFNYCAGQSYTEEIKSIRDFLRK